MEVELLYSGKESKLDNLNVSTLTKILCGEQGCAYYTAPDKKIVLKMFDDLDSDFINISKKNLFKNEVDMLVKLKSSGVAPEIYNAWICDNTGFILMEGFNTCTNLCDQSLLYQVVDLAAKLSKEGIMHNDLKKSNLACKDGKVFLIDFGMATSEATSEIANEIKRQQERKKLTWDDLKEINVDQILDNFLPAKCPSLDEMRKLISEQLN